MRDYFHSYVIDTRDWGRLKIMKVLPRNEDPWGALAPFKDTEWGSLVHIVSGEALSHALHGHATPLVNELGPEPQRLARRLTDKLYCRLHQEKLCHLRSEHCIPKTEKMPECYEVPDVPFTHSSLLYYIAMAVRENRYVIVVEGEEFAL